LSNIRVTYSGLIAFAVAIASVLTGSIFTLIITRRLEPAEFGIWAIIGSMIGYFLIIEPIISFWSTRQIARGKPIGKTSLLSSSIFAVGTIPIYLVLAYFVSDVKPEFLNSMFLGTLLIPVLFISQTLAGINLGHKPHATSIGLLAFESLKIPSCLGLVFILDLGVNGAILATLIAYIGKIVIQLFFAKSKLNVKIDFLIFKNWLKNAWLPLYTNVSHVLWTLDVVIFTIISGSVIGVAYYTASLVITNVVVHSGMVSQALYPKLLAKGNQSHITDNFSRLLYFAIPLLAITILFSEYALFALNPIYASMGFVVTLLAFRSFFYVINSTFYQILLGIETVDVEKNFRFSKLIGSKLFIVPTITNIHYSIYILILAIILFVFNDSTETELVIMWSMISLGLSIPFVIYVGILVKKYTEFKILYNDILKYGVGTMGIIIIFFFTNEYIITYETSIYSYLPGLFIELIICVAVYLGITYSIDYKTRKLFKSIISEIFPRKT